MDKFLREVSEAFDAFIEFFASGTTFLLVVLTLPFWIVPYTYRKLKALK